MASRSEVVNGSLNQSRLWNHCTVCLLKRNMRLGSATTDIENKKISDFSNWVLDIGDGKVDNIHPEQRFSDPEILIPKQYLI